jgi:hypothetical protein
MFCCGGALEAQRAGTRAAANKSKKTKQSALIYARDVRRLMRGKMVLRPLVLMPGLKLLQATPAMLKWRESRSSVTRLFAGHRVQFVC